MQPSGQLSINCGTIDWFIAATCFHSPPLSTASFLGSRKYFLNKNLNCCITHICRPDVTWPDFLYLSGHNKSRDWITKLIMNSLDLMWITRVLLSDRSLCYFWPRKACEVHFGSPTLCNVHFCVVSNWLATPFTRAGASLICHFCFSSGWNTYSADSQKQQPLVQLSHFEVWTCVLQMTKHVTHGCVTLLHNSTWRRQPPSDYVWSQVQRWDFAISIPS